MNDNLMESDCFICSDCSRLCHIDSGKVWGREDIVCDDCDFKRTDSLAEWTAIAAVESGAQCQM